MANKTWPRSRRSRPPTGSPDAKGGGAGETPSRRSFADAPGYPLCDEGADLKSLSSDVTLSSSSSASSSESLAMSSFAPLPTWSPTPSEWQRMGAFHTPGARWADLTALSLLGQGEFCAVYATELDGKPIALKVLRKTMQKFARSISDFNLEIQLMSRLNHPNVVRPLAAGLHPCGLPFLCLERLATTLADELPKPVDAVPFWKRISAVRRWPLKRAINYAKELAAALAYCHHHAFDGYRVLHRDLKPKNIGITQSGRLVLFDFGLAAVWKVGDDDEAGKEKRRLTGETGSLRYMAPEMALNHPYNHKSEVFSFGRYELRPIWSLCHAVLFPMHYRHVSPQLHHVSPLLSTRSILYEMGSHKRPFAGMDEDMYLNEICSSSKRPDPPKSWPDELSQLLRRCWDADLDLRPDFLEVQDILNKMVEFS